MASPIMTVKTVSPTIRCRKHLALSVALSSSHPNSTNKIDSRQSTFQVSVAFARVKEPR
jgi:hypothetical protein